MPPLWVVCRGERKKNHGEMKTDQWYVTFINDSQSGSQSCDAIAWCIYIECPCRHKWRPATSDLSHLTLMNRGELLWQRMAYLIPAHLRRWPRPSCYALGLSAPPTMGQSNFGHIYFLWKVREAREWEKEGLGDGGGREEKGVVQVQVSGY